MNQTLLFILIFTLFLALYIYTATRLFQLLPPIGFWRILLVSIFALGIASLVLFFTIGEIMPVSVAKVGYIFGTSWLLIFVYLFIAVACIDIFKLLNHFLHIIDKQTVATIFSQNKTTSLILFGTIALLFLWGNRQYHNKKRLHYTIRSEKVESPVRIVAISDLHLGYTISAKELQTWVEMINAENPDMILIGGDIIDNHLRPVNKDSMGDVLKKLQAPLGVFACPGNHDWMFAMHENPHFYAQAGITMLADSVVSKDEITVMGRDDRTNPNRKTISQIKEMVNDSTFTILLDHQPFHLNEAANATIDLQFSGHTHRGQIFPVSLLVDRIYELPHGYREMGGTHFIVSSGLGIWGGKFRIGTRSDYVVLDIVPDK